MTKDADGFEDIDDFWNSQVDSSISLNSRGSKILEVDKNQPSRRSSIGTIGTDDTSFNYDTTSSISG